MMSLITFLAKRFIAGQRLSQALDVVEQLNRDGFMTSLDHLGEKVTSEAEANAATEQYITILEALKDRGLNKNISVKLTQIGLAISRSLCERNLAHIVKKAYDVDGFVRVDIEGSDYTQATFEVIKSVKTNAAPLGAAVQVMLKRTPDDVAGLLDREIPIRLCKGAYKEPPAIAYQKREEIDRAYLALMKRMLTASTYNAIATHDVDLIDATKAFAKNNRVARDSFEFQMLMGIRRPLQRKLKDDGWNVRIYVPFGKQWLPYMLRRLRERKENTLFLLKHMFMR